MIDTRQNKALVAALAEFAKAWPRTTIPEATANDYMEELSDLTVEQIARAVKVIKRTESFYPAIATIRKAALLDPDRITAEQGWDLLCERIRQVGFNGGSGDLDPEIKAAMNACGGWGEHCRSHTPDTDRYYFIKAFNAAREEADRKLLVDGDQTPQTPQEMPAELTEGTRQIGPVEQLPPAEDRANNSLERLREARKQIEENRRQREQEIPDELVEGLKKIGHREEQEPLEDKFKTSLERLRQARKDIEENRKQSEQR